MYAALKNCKPLAMFKTCLKKYILFLQAPCFIDTALKFTVTYMLQMYDLVRYFMLLQYLMFCLMLSCSLNWFWFWFDLFHDVLFRSFNVFFFFFWNWISHNRFNVVINWWSWSHFNAFHIIIYSFSVLLRSDMILVFLLLLLKYSSLFFFSFDHIYTCTYLSMFISITDPRKKGSVYLYIWFPITILCY